MRTANTTELAVAAAGGQTAACRVLLQDSASNWWDLTTLFDRDWVLDVQVTEDVEDQIARADIHLARATFNDNLAPLVSGSRPQLLAAQPLVRVGARVRVESQLVPLGRPLGSTWRRIFDGYVEDLDAAGEEVALSCRDLASALQRRWIEEERVYGVWAPSRRIIAGTAVVPTTDAPNDSSVARYMLATTTGTTSSSEPSWPAKGSGSTVSDGGVTWQEQSTVKGIPAETLLQSLLDDTLGAGTVTLSCPSSPSWIIRDYNQRKQSLWDALKAVAQGNGWDLRYVWNDGASDFKLTYFGPVRSGGTASYTLGSGKYRDVQTCKQSLNYVRNVIVVKWYDRATLDSQKNPTPTPTTASDAVSIAAYGRQWMEIIEEATSQIDTSTEAGTLAQAILSDLKEPVLDLVVTTDHIFWLQLHDYVDVEPDAQHFDSTQTLAVTAIRQSFKGGVATTEYSLAGRATCGRRRWHDIGAGPSTSGQNRLLGPRAPRSVSVSATIGGLTVTFLPPTDPREQYAATDLYLSTTNGFTPSASNRVATSKAGRFDVTGLTAGTAYYVRVAHRDRQGNRSEYSSQLSATPATVTSGIGAGDIGTTQIANGAVTNPKIGSLAVDTGQLAANAVTTAKIAAGAVDTTALGASAVTTAKLAAGAVDSTALGSAAVTTAKIASGAVTSTELGSGAVTTAKIASGAVTSTELAADAVTTAKILNANVTTVKVADGAITIAKIDPTVRNNFRARPTSDASGVSVDSPLSFATEDYDGRGNWSSDTWTVQEDGTYLVNIRLHLTGASSGDRAQVVLARTSGTAAAVAASGWITASQDSGGSYEITASLTTVVVLAKNDVVKVQYKRSGSGSWTLKAPSFAAPGSGQTQGSFIEVQQLLV